MPKSSVEIIKALKDNDWDLVRIKGSHHHYKKAGNPNLITVAHPTKDIPKGTLRKIEKMSGLKLR
jgi:predicted RNA binding protein YcfA (HicA-like mRNA interferase family)